MEPHGGELLGFVVMRGEREKLNHVRSSDEFLRLNARAGLVINNFGVVAGFSGEALNRQFASFQEQASELTSGIPTQHVRETGHSTKPARRLQRAQEGQAASYSPRLCGWGDVQNYTPS